MLLQNMPLWHMDYFELSTTELNKQTNKNPLSTSTCRIALKPMLMLSFYKEIYICVRNFCSKRYFLLSCTKENSLKKIFFSIFIDQL